MSLWQAVRRKFSLQQELAATHENLEALSAELALLEHDVHEMAGLVLALGVVRKAEALARLHEFEEVPPSPTA